MAKLNSNIGKEKAARSYTAEDHATWAKLFARQKKLVSKLACKEYFEGMKKLALDPEHVPDINKTSVRLRKLSGWNLSNAKNKSLAMRDWFRKMYQKSFPVTDYIRKPEDFDYTRMPDLFHEYFGHLPYFTDKNFAAIAYQFGVLCRHADKRQLLQISRIWSLGIEFGLIRERGRIKFLGAGLLSSYGECLHAKKLIKRGKVTPFNLREVITTPGKTYEYHPKYFILKNIREVADVLRAYAQRESLPVAA